jgi:hypothetical protein
LFPKFLQRLYFEDRVRQQGFPNFWTRCYAPLLHLVIPISKVKTGCYYQLSLGYEQVMKIALSAPTIRRVHKVAGAEAGGVKIDE